MKHSNEIMKGQLPSEAFLAQQKRRRRELVIKRRIRPDLWHTIRSTEDLVYAICPAYCDLKKRRLSTRWTRSIVAKITRPDVSGLAWLLNSVPYLDLPLR